MPSIVDFLSAFGDQGEMHDFQHASRLYLDNNYALAPKTSWLYYVVFSIEPSAITETQWKNQRRDYEAGMLVKQVDLPKFKMAVETLNQYNRKTNIQTKITYEPINFTFHDDHSNVVNSLWVNYFRYYYYDTWYGQKVGLTSELTNKPAGFKNNKYEPSEAYINSPDGRSGNPGAYGLNNNQSKPFFNAITIYQLNQKRFTSYIIVNPLITSWEHDHLDQTQGTKFAENKMTVAYETVFYGEGKVRRDAPSGFATFHYDVTPSPLSIAGGGTNTIFGPGGIISGIDDIFGAEQGLLSRGLSGSPINLLGAGIAGANLLKNARNITRESLKAEGQSILNSALQGAIAGAGGGLTGFLNGGAGALSSALGFGPKNGTLLIGSNFVANQATASAGDVVGGLTAGGTTPTGPTDIQSQESIENINSEGQIADLKDNNNLRITELNSKLEDSQKIQAEVDEAVNNARAVGGPNAADAVYKEYVTSKGYEDPAKIQQTLDAYKKNNDALDKRLTAISITP